MPYSLEEAYSVILHNPYERDAIDGFEVLKFSPTAFRARFIEKVVNVEIISNPFGESQEVVSTRYVINKFLIEKRSGFFLVALENPTRSVRNLIRKFSSIFGVTKFSVASVSIDIPRLESFISQATDVRFHVNKAHISNIVLSNSCSASVEITSVDNALDDVRRSFPGKAFDVDKARFTVQGTADKTFFEAKSSGQISISGPKEEVVYAIIKEFVGNGG